MGLFLPGVGFAKGFGGSSVGDTQCKVELKQTRRGPMDILIVQSLDHLVSRQIKQGFQERLAEEEGWGFRFVTYDVKGKFANTHVLAQLLSRKEVDLVLAIGASAAQTATLASKLKAQITAKDGSEAVVAIQASPERAAVNPQPGPKREGAASQCGLEGADTQPIPEASPTPIVFTAVVDPFYIHILPKNGTLEHVYGVLDPPPLQEQLRLIRLLLPGLERLGVVYSEDVVTVVKLVEDLKEMAPVFGIDVLAVPLRSLEGVAAGYDALAPEVDAFFMPLDDRLLVQVDLILALAHKAYVPVFASDTASVERGALAALGYNYHEGGRVAAELALRALKAQAPAGGTSLADLPQLVQQKQRLTLNQKTARRLRIVFPASALREADSILD